MERNLVRILPVATIIVLLISMGAGTVQTEATQPTNEGKVAGNETTAEAILDSRDPDLPGNETTAEDILDTRDPDLPGNETTAGENQDLGWKLSAVPVDQESSEEEQKGSDHNERIGEYQQDGERFS